MRVELQRPIYFSYVQYVWQKNARKNVRHSLAPGKRKEKGM